MANPAKPAHYLPIYERLLAPYRDEPLTLLELGVHKGESLLFWRELLPAARIIGIDTNTDLVPAMPPGIEVVRGDAADAALLARYSPDVVVDDASHRWNDQQASWAALWPRTTRLYVIEDLELCYLPQSEWAVGRNTMDWLMGEVRAMHLGHAGMASITFHRGLAVMAK